MTEKEMSEQVENGLMRIKTIGIITEFKAKNGSVESINEALAGRNSPIMIDELITVQVGPGETIESVISGGVRPSTSKEVSTDPRKLPLFQEAIEKGILEVIDGGMLRVTKSIGQYLNFMYDRSSRNEIPLSAAYLATKIVQRTGKPYSADHIRTVMYRARQK